MRFRAINLREVGPFVAGASVAGIGPGLNVLAAPNEAGKSTLFRAVEVLFREKHTSTRKHTPGKPASPDTLRPLSGGAPFVSCEFETDGVIWRLEKQFLQQRSALLTRLDGRERHRGEEVDGRLRELLGGDGAASELLALVWVGQGAGLEWSPPEASQRSGLDGLIAHEADAAAGLTVLKATRAAVSRDLDALMTDKRSKPRKGGALDLAHVAVARWQAAHSEARELAAAADRHRQEHASARRELAQLTDPEAVATEGTRRDQLRQRQQSAAEADRRVASAEQSVALCKAELNRLQDQSKWLMQRCEAAAQAATLDEAIETQQALHADAARELERLTGDVEVALANVVAQEADLEMARARVRFAELSTQRADLERAVARVAAAQESVRAAEAEVAKQTLSSEGLRDLEVLHRRHEAVMGRLESGAPRVAINYETGVRGRFEIDGRPLASDDELVAREMLEIVVPGVGRIRVTPAASEDRTALVAEEGRLRADLRERFDRYRVADMQEARALAARDLETRQALDLAKQRFADTQAADPARKLSDLSSELERLATRVGIEPAALAEAPDADPVAAAETALATHKESLAAANSLRAAAAERLRDAEQSLQADRLRREQALASVARLDDDLRAAQKLGPSEPLDVETLEPTIARQGRAAREALDLALEDRETVVAAQLSGDERAEIGTQLATVEAAIADRLAKARWIEDALIELKTKMEQDTNRKLGLGEQLRIAEEELAAAHEHLERVDRRTQALLRLEEELDVEIDHHAASTVAPIVRRMRARLGPVLGDGVFDLQDGMAAGTLSRSGQPLPFDRLSGGTQEQIAILARLAYAELLSDAGHPLPVVLDDALVFADDARREQVFAALAEAASRHQVILLTCHEAAFDQLCTRYAATRLDLSIGALPRRATA